jgi:hypothetical protein
MRFEREVKAFVFECGEPIMGQLAASLAAFSSNFKFVFSQKKKCKAHGLWLIMNQRMPKTRCDEDLI